MLLRFLKMRPFLWLGGFALLTMVVGQAVPLQYDDGRWGTAWFVAFYTLTAPFRWASNLIGSILGTGVGFAHGALTLLVGSTAYVACDWLVTRLSRSHDDE
jgi:hypothetical protein